MEPPSRSDSPERNLWASVLLRAFEDLRLPKFRADAVLFLTQPSEVGDLAWRAVNRDPDRMRTALRNDFGDSLELFPGMSAFRKLRDQIDSSLTALLDEGD